MNPTAEQIRELRLAAGLSMAAVSRIMGVHRSTVEHWEYGRNKMRGPTWRLYQIEMAAELAAAIDAANAALCKTRTRI